MSVTEKEDQKTTHFGYEEVNWEEKQGKVAQVFHSVAGKYDLMNDLMSFGVHRLWKRFTVAKSHVKKGDKVLDIAGGTGDLAFSFCQKVGPTGKVILSDINHSMLMVGKERLTDKGCIGNIVYVQANAECLPFKDNHFDIITIAFGLRNVTDKGKALRSMYKKLKPGGRLFVLEFSKPIIPLLSKVYDAYSFTALPFMGKIIANDSESYKYLAESIRKHPGQEELLSMFKEAGFDDPGFHNLTGGVVALHYGYKY